MIHVHHTSAWWTCKHARLSYYVSMLSCARFLHDQWSTHACILLTITNARLYFSKESKCLNHGQQIYFVTQEWINVLNESFIDWTQKCYLIWIDCIISFLMVMGKYYAKIQLIELIVKLITKISIGLTFKG